MRLTLHTYYNDNPVIVKVLYHKNETLWDSNYPDTDDIEIINAYTESGKRELDIEELSEDEEFMSDLMEELSITLVNQTEEEYLDEDESD